MEAGFIISLLFFLSNAAAFVGGGGYLHFEVGLAAVWAVKRRGGSLFIHIFLIKQLMLCFLQIKKKGAH